MSNHEQDNEGPVPGLRQLRADALPERDLWPGVQLRLQPRRASRAPWISLALAASLVMGLAVSVRQQGSLPMQTPVAQTVASANPIELRGHDRALVKAHLQIVDDAEKQLRDALKHAPDSPSLQRLLDSNKKQRRDLRRLLSKSPA